MKHITILKKHCYYFLRKYYKISLSLYTYYLCAKNIFKTATYLPTLYYAYQEPTYLCTNIFLEMAYYCFKPFSNSYEITRDASIFCYLNT